MYAKYIRKIQNKVKIYAYMHESHRINSQF